MALPQTSGPSIKPDEILAIALRYRWLLVLPLCVTLTVGGYMALTLPRIYSASTTILVQGQKVPGSYVKSIVTTGIEQRINTISQQIMSHTNLERIIRQFGLFQGENQRNMFPEDKVKVLRNRIKVKLTRARGGTDAFTIVYQGTDPRRVKDITNTLAGLYMDENLKLREAQAVGTSEFLDAELEKTRKKLELREKALSDYRTRYMGGLPDELESNLRTLDRLQQQLTDRQGMLQATRSTMAMMKSRMTRGDASPTLPLAVAAGEGNPALDGRGNFSSADTAVRLARAEQDLEELLLRYTDKHPDVVKQRAVIDRLKLRLKKENADRDDTMGPQKEEKDALPEVRPVTPEKEAGMQQRLQLGQLEGELAQLQREIERIKERMTVYQRRVEETPQREQELRALERDYGNIQDVYSSLLDRKLEAELSVNMERKQKGEQFRILDAARLPQRPISPDVKKLFALSMVAGAGCGGGIIFLLVFLDNTIRRDEDIEQEVGLPILASIAPIKRRKDRVRDRLKWILFTLFLGYAVMLLGIFALLNLKGVDVLNGIVYRITGS